MNNQVRSDVQKFTISDYAWELLEQWRGILALGLIFAVLVSAVKYKMDVREYREKLAAMETLEAPGTEEAGAEEETEAEAAEEAEAVETVVSPETMLAKTLYAYTSWQMRKEYYEKSPLMRVDPDEDKRMRLTYFIQAKDPEKTDANLVMNSYSRIFTDDSFCKELAQAVDCSSDPEFVRELISFSAPDQSQIVTQMPSQRFDVYAMLLPGSSPDRIEQLVTGHLKDMKKDIAAVTGDFTISLFSKSFYTVHNQDRLDAQKDAYNKMLSSKSDYVKNYNVLTEEEKAIIEEIIEAGSSDETLRKIHAGEFQVSIPLTPYTGAVAKELPQELPEPPSIHLMNGVLGFSVGAFLYMLLYIYLSVFRRRIMSDRSIENMTGLHSYGSVCEYPYKSALQRFLHDRKIYSMRHRQMKGSDPAEKVSENIAVHAEHLNIPAVTIAALGSLSKHGEEILRKQAEQLEKDGKLTAGTVSLQNGSSMLDEKDFASMQCAILTAVYNQTTPEMIAGFLARCEEYGVKVLGIEYLECV